MRLLTELKTVLNAVKEFETSPLMQTMDVVVESTHPLVQGKQEAVFEVTFNEATKILVTDDKNLFRHVLTASNPKKNHSIAELRSAAFKSVSKPLQVVENYWLPSCEAGYKFKYHPEVRPRSEGSSCTDKDS